MGSGFLPILEHFNALMVNLDRVVETTVPMPIFTASTSLSLYLIQIVQLCIPCTPKDPEFAKTTPSHKSESGYPGYESNAHHCRETIYYSR